MDPLDLLDRPDDDEFLERPVAAVQDDLFVLDAIKGLEALAEMVSSAVSVRYPEFRAIPTEELQPGEGSDDPEDPPMETIDDLHHFIRETKRFAKGARQQLEQRLFGGTPK